MLEEFHRTFQLPICRTFAEAQASNLKLRHNLILEEYSEYSHAKERVDILDALGDLLYVVAGTWITIGIFPAEYAANPPPTRTNYKIEILPQVSKYLEELRKDHLCYKGLYGSTTPLYWRLETAAYTLGVDLLTVVRRIHASNMTKLWTDKLVAEHWTNLPGHAANRVRDNLFVVKRVSDGKVIKST